MTIVTSRLALGSALPLALRLSINGTAAIMSVRRGIAEASRISVKVIVASTSALD